MSLFIGNISSSVTVSELEKTFREFGHCKINYKGAYSFAEFDNEKDAEEAKSKLKGKNMGGRELNIEWSKKSNRYDDGKRRRSISPKGRCFNCGHRGHFAKDCHERRRSHSGSRNRSRRYRRSNSRSRRNYRRKDSHSSPSRSQSHSRSRSRSRSRSISKSNSRSRSPKRTSRKRKMSSESPLRKDDNRVSANKDHSKSRSKDMDIKNMSPIKQNDYDEKKESNKNINISNNLVEKNENMNQINTDKKIEDSDINKDTPMKITTSDKNDELNPHDEKQVKESENGKGVPEGAEIDFKIWTVEKLKSELKLKNIPIPKNAKKSDLIDLLNKSSA